jgi:hypothetical protein
VADETQQEAERGSNTFVELEPGGETVEIPASVFAEGVAAIEHWLEAQRQARRARSRPARRTAAHEE